MAHKLPLTSQHQFRCSFPWGPWESNFYRRLLKRCPSLHLPLQRNCPCALQHAPLRSHPGRPCQETPLHTLQSVIDRFFQSPQCHEHLSAYLPNIQHYILYTRTYETSFNLARLPSQPEICYNNDLKWDALAELLRFTWVFPVSKHPKEPPGTVTVGIRNSASNFTFLVERSLDLEPLVTARGTPLYPAPKSCCWHLKQV